HVGGQLHPFGGGAEHELAGVEDERAFVLRGHLDEFGQILEVLFDVDDRRRVVAEHPEVAIDRDVDRRWLDAALTERIDLDATRRERLADAAIGEDHVGSTVLNSASRLASPRSTASRRCWAMSAI